MVRAEEIQRITPELAFWQAYEPSVKCDLSSCAVDVGGRLVLIDPIPMAESALKELVESSRPALIILTNGNHERAADSFRQQFGIPIAAHGEAISEFELKPDQVLADQTRLLEAIDVI